MQQKEVTVQQIDLDALAELALAAKERAWLHPIGVSPIWDRQLVDSARAAASALADAVLALVERVGELEAKHS